MGNTGSRIFSIFSATVHPHTHGEHFGEITTVRKRGGSSPHTWGTPLHSARVKSSRRFIPTHMGNTKMSGSCPNVLTVHPHTHGEHDFFIIHLAANRGSSPHTWGTHGHGPSDRLDRRFIPTHMGNTSRAAFADRSSTVHPHTHGEHCLSVSLTLLLSGSSPHTWGTLGVYWSRIGAWRFIPTHMGNTTNCPGKKLARSVHPHTHGEHPRLQSRISPRRGSSPHTWGTLIIAPSI